MLIVVWIHWRVKRCQQVLTRKARLCSMNRREEKRKYSGLSDARGNLFSCVILNQWQLVDLQWFLLFHLIYLTLERLIEMITTKSHLISNHVKDLNVDWENKRKLNYNYDQYSRVVTNVIRNTKNEKKKEKKCTRWARRLLEDEERKSMKHCVRFEPIKNFPLSWVVVQYLSWGHFAKLSMSYSSIFLYEHLFVRLDYCSSRSIACLPSIKRFFLFLNCAVKSKTISKKFSDRSQLQFLSFLIYTFFHLDAVKLIILFAVRVDTLNGYVSLSFILASKLCCSFNSAGESRQKKGGKEIVSFVPLCVSNIIVDPMMEEGREAETQSH